MRLGLNLGYWSRAEDAERLELAVAAERFGYSIVWAAEAYGSDAATVLAWIGARTHRIEVGSAVMQIPARTPAMTAMTAATLDTLTGGRFALGLGVSGPQVSEGWHGVPFAHPLGRTREYVEIVRSGLRRERLRYAGRHYQLPLPDGPGQALRLTVTPPRPDLPVYLAAVGPRNLELAGEVADGWLSVFFAPGHADASLAALRAGRERVGRDLDGFDVVASVPLVVGPDWRRCADAVRPHAALYVGGMGSRKQNFYRDMAVRMGFEREAEEVQRRYLDRDHAGAMAALPLEFLDAVSLLGPQERITERMTVLAEAGVTTLAVNPLVSDVAQAADTLRIAAEAWDASGVG
ncbi:LLM class F420-dependent oxidoreductase [Actinoalloteichus spitiensis]|uniref:LLM class F420-dependent oxidoreductase n=1 Tax=Actinoalloteichus spitiensis TaxID=252394 RepID=UPI0004744854|nr:LLM class F420-dependent oxidoreductase [Actinoalloteichus spitiensis]